MMNSSEPCASEGSIESDVQALAYLTVEHWARLIGTTAYGYHIVPCFIEINVHALGGVRGEIDT